MALPQEEFVTWLEGLTNVRLEASDRSDSGYRVVGHSLPDWLNPPRW